MSKYLVDTSVTRGTPIGIMVAKESTFGNIFHATGIMAASLYGGTQPSARQGTRLISVYGNGLFVDIPFAVARLAYRDFRHVRRNEEHLNFSDENIPLIVDFYRAAQKDPSQERLLADIVRPVICGRQPEYA